MTKLLFVPVQVTETGHADRLIAERAERQRREARQTHRRKEYMDSLGQVMGEARIALTKKHAIILALPNSTSLSSGGGGLLHSDPPPGNSGRR